MNQETKKQINTKYERKLLHGERFWPDSIYKDVVVALAIFVLLVLLATFVGVHDSPKADPSDTSYIPRPEWYFLFLFKFLALYGQIPLLGQIEWIATILIPGAALAVLTLLPFIDKSPHRYYAKRALPLAIMFIMVLGIVLLTVLADIPTVLPDGSTLLGMLQTTAGLILPTLAYIAFIGLAYTQKENAVRAITWTAAIAGLLMIALTAATLLVYQPPVVETVEVPTALADQIAAGQDLYSIHCVECHGDDGKVEEISGVEGLEGKQISMINSKDVLYTVNDASMAEIIAYGRPDAGMNPFGKAYNPEGLSRSEIDYIVLFMRYTWDDRFEAPPVKPLYPALAEGEIPTYSVHIQPIVKRYCISCHRPGKDSNNYFMDTYANILTSGDHAENNVIAGEMNSNLLQTIQHQVVLDENGSEVIGVMPPKSQLKPAIIDIFILWIMNGMPQ
ncbi:MAG: c-type cytochrome [Anaerolineales bacterium]|jgi:mono/diheme cytochrome c family protein|nr:c-type cytochrome [Anaerolineales bacterium]